MSVNSKQKVLVTGASGMIGRAVVAHLLSCGYEVKAQVRDRPKFVATMAWDHLFGQVELIEVDFTGVTEPQMSRLVDGCYAVIHCAALVHEPKACFAAYELVNIHTTRQLAEASAVAGVDTFIFLSTTAVYGQGPYDDITEDSSVQPVTPYAVSKAQSEAWLQSFTELGRTVILRPPLVFGEGDRGNMLTLIRQIKKRRFFHIGDKLVRKSVIYSRDLAQAIGLCLKDLSQGLHLCNVANPQPVTLKALAGEIASCLGVSSKFATIPSPIVYLAAQLSEVFLKERSPVTIQQLERLTTSTTCSVESFKTATGFKPTVTLHDALKAEICWAEGLKLL